MQQDPRRLTPRTDAVLADPRLDAALAQRGRPAVKWAVSLALDACRRQEIEPESVVAATLDHLASSPISMQQVVNATGIIVHTNLGRAPLSAAAIEATRIASGVTDVEFDLDVGDRRPRGAGAMAALTKAVPDAEAVHVVNNGAAALALVANCLALGREIIVARGELVEIGDGFRIPELLESAGARLREVGTTNRVRLDDYIQAVGQDTACLLKVHPSNFRVEGFTSSVSVASLSTLAVPLVVDIGSGLLTSHARLPDEPDAASVLRAGADLVTASGDKLLGGPQCGLLLGTQELVSRLRRHPLARALRVDKLTLAALEATLTGPPNPTAEALATTPDQLLARAASLVRAIGSDVALAVRSVGRVGGGGAPGVPIPSASVTLPSHLAGPLRKGQRSIVGHVHSGRLHLDLLAVPEPDDAVLLAAVRQVLEYESSRVN